MPRQRTRPTFDNPVVPLAAILAANSIFENGGQNGPLGEGALPSGPRISDRDDFAGVTAWWTFSWALAIFVDLCRFCFRPKSPRPKWSVLGRCSHLGTRISDPADFCGCHHLVDPLENPVKPAAKRVLPVHKMVSGLTASSKSPDPSQTHHFGNIKFSETFPL